MPLLSCPRVLTATAGQVMYNVPFCLSLELVGSKEKVPFLPWITYKTLLGNLAQVPFALFEALISLVAMFFRDWSTLQWTVSAATFLQVRDAKRNLLVL